MRFLIERVTYCTAPVGAARGFTGRQYRIVHSGPKLARPTSWAGRWHPKSIYCLLYGYNLSMEVALAAALSVYIRDRYLRPWTWLPVVCNKKLTIILCKVYTRTRYVWKPVLICQQHGWAPSHVPYNLSTKLLFWSYCNWKMVSSYSI